jgi:hypothetical protein
MMVKRVVKVSRSQINAARALIELRGGPDKVDPLTRKIAEARPRGAGVADQAS